MIKVCLFVGRRYHTNPHRESDTRYGFIARAIAIPLSISNEYGEKFMSLETFFQTVRMYI
ncbi:hypothetical protein QUF65_05465 [Lysinibacillus sphaericus]|uniref:Uncharacterized protein n=1 Tax=Lysinibacillus sphaericus (strain C3-41) TaxID=444177 RepID=B1HWS9_LYSSC|nr:MULTISPECIES: hypothetical protein [Lysinibacillus]ACA39914.1 hypothetical protein Bsph_2355 [Lysinibacillus sphaericus C3-41]MBE5082356.1 hypothetical protein [Bacillus thuringiensis]MDM5350328.1 hypothetical protein [Lysinibacillus sphaericus]QPA60377.1 hypothetical protein INQ55_08585 [Lysinibacillus sphaericus]QTB24132.1 hypothetical protein J1907_08815 [Lysinibacillus sphaericus]